MANWNTNPTYTPLTEINSGQKYVNGDGIMVDDINKLFENVKHLKERFSYVKLG